MHLLLFLFPPIAESLVCHSCECLPERESTGGGMIVCVWLGRGVCDNEKRRTTSVFARCSFCDPHLALSHGG